MTSQLQEFAAGLPDFSENTSSNRWLVVHFSYFLTEIRREAISPENLRRCYEDLSLPAPRNISDVILKSRAFVKTRQGWRLHHDKRSEIQGKISNSTANAVDVVKVSEKSRSVVVVYGRDKVVRASLFQFLRALKLNPIEWSEAVTNTGRGSPYVGHVLDTMFGLAQGVVVLLTPDENVSLKPSLRSPDDNNRIEQQPRPNVLIEAGMALARDEAHTVIVQVGRIREISDLSGRHVIHLNDSAEKRLELAQRLQTIGCAVSTGGTDWLSVGKFSPSP